MLRRIFVSATVSLLAGTGLAVAAWLPAAPAQATPSAPFNQCPAIGADTSCATLVDITSNGSPSILTDGSQPPMDNNDDSLIGVQNDSGQAIAALPVQGSTGIFGFDGDGLCVQNPHPGGCPFGSTGYEGPGTSFTGISGDTKSGTITFTPPLAPGGSAYFSLEGVVTGSTLVIDSLIQASPVQAGVTATASSTGTVATFTDSDPVATAAEYSASIDWGDASTSSGTVSGTAPNFVVSGTHAYGAPGTFTVKVTITDTDNSPNSATVSSTFTASSPCPEGQTCTTSVNGSNGQTSKLTISSSTAPTVNVVIGQDALSCGDTFAHASLVTTFSTSNVTSTSAKHVTLIIRNANPTAQYQVCFQSPTPFTDINGHTVTTGILPACSRKTHAPCMLLDKHVGPGLKTVEECFNVTANDPKFF